MWKTSDISCIVSFALSICLFVFFLHRYGHGYEIFCVASSPDGSLLASACKVCISNFFSLQRAKSTSTVCRGKKKKRPCIQDVWSRFYMQRLDTFLLAVFKKKKKNRGNKFIPTLLTLARLTFDTFYLTSDADRQTVIFIPFKNKMIINVNPRIA